MDRKRTGIPPEKKLFLISAVITAAIALWGIVGNQSFAYVADRLMSGLKKQFSWLYLWVMLLFVLFSLVIALSPWGKIRLGADGDRPEYSTLTWFAMLFGAGMGIGLVFWGMAEPLSHYVQPMAGIEPQSAEAVRFSMRSSFMHWGVHPWSCYAIVGLGLAYFQFRKKKPAAASSLLTPFSRGGKWGRGLGLAVDIYTTVLTAIGVATSFGMGCLQISGGLQELFGIPSSLPVWLVLITVICILYLKTAISGVDKGIKLLSDINLLLFLILMAASYLVGDLAASLRMGGRGLLDYICYFFPDSVRLSSQGDSSWIENWRVFYWAWWLSWAPFVGTFIARISRGRTVRQFLLGVIVIPTIVSVLWFTAFGGLALSAAEDLPRETLLAMIAKPELTLFQILEMYPLGHLLCLIAMGLLVTFFVTSANSATFVLAMLTSGGKLDPPVSKKVFWGLLIAVLALALIFSGGISMIQTISIVIAFPYLLFLILICISLVLAFRRDSAA